MAAMRIYKDSDTLWADTLEKKPGFVMAHGHIGKSLFNQGKSTRR